MLGHILADGSERPVMYASASLSKTERNYSQIEKESLSIIYRVKKFHNYLYGRKFFLYNDHKPLQSLLSPLKALPPVAAARVQRWAVTLSGYDYIFKYKEGKGMRHADALSRLPLSTEKSGESVKYFSIVKELPLSFRDIATETRKDPTLSVVNEYIQNGWPNSHVTDEVLPYFKLKEYLNLDQNYVMFSNRIVIPKKLRTRVLSLIHDQHPGVVKMKMLPRQYVYWNNINKDIEKVVKECECCQLNRGSVPQAPLTFWTWRTRKWQRLHLDTAQKADTKFLVLIDSHRKWVDAWILKTTNAANVIARLRKSFAVFGLPDEIHSDNGPPFNSEEYADFCTFNGIKVLKSPPLHPVSNGITERCIQLFKNNLIKQIFEDRSGLLTGQEKLDNFLFFYRNIPHSLTQMSSAEVMLKQKPKTRLILLKPNLNKYVQNKQTHLVERQNEKIPENKYFNFKEEDRVYVKNVRGEKDKWSKGVVKARISPVTYIVMIDNMIRYVHVDHLRGANKPESGGEDYAIPVARIENRDNPNQDHQFDSGGAPHNLDGGQLPRPDREKVSEGVQTSSTNNSPPASDNTVESGVEPVRRSTRVKTRPDRYRYYV